MKSCAAILMTVFLAYVNAAPQFITFSKEGKLGVNFGGYHAGVGLGGLLGGGSAGGLFAEAGTPFGQSARAGLGGAVDSGGLAKGGLYAGATAGGNVKASAGLAGEVGGASSHGGGYAAAQAGGHHASSGLEGVSSVEGSTGFAASGSSDGLIETPTNIVKETVYVKPAPVIHKKIHTEFKFDAGNEVNSAPVASETKTEVKEKVKVKSYVQPELIKEVHYLQPATIIKEKHIIHTHEKPRHQHHFRKSAYIGGYLGSDVVPAPQPAIQKRIDVDTVAEAAEDSDTYAHGNGGGQIKYNTQFKYKSNPTFFADIFNIPIATLQAVSNLVGNTVKNTSISVQKSASINADADAISSKHEPSSSSIAKSASSEVSIQTPDFSKTIDDIFAIPINTLSAVNKFLENNVPTRKRLEISADVEGEPTKLRLGPHARRRLNRNKIVILEQSSEKPEERVIES